MANSKISSLTELSSVAVGDLIPIVDISDTTDGPSGTTKKITKANLVTALGTGTVTSVSIVTANGISGSVANPTTTPAITLTLGVINPTSVNGLTLASQAIGFTIAGGTTSKTLTVPLDASVSGTNTGDNATNSQYSGLSASKADVGQTMYIGTTAVAINRASAVLVLTGITSIDGLSATATALATSRAIYGNNFNGTADLTQVIASTYGGTGNGFTKFSGPATAEKTFTLPNANATLLYDGGALGTPSSGNLANCTGLTYPVLTVASYFESASRLSNTVIGTGSQSLGAEGLTMSSGATSGSSNSTTFSWIGPFTKGLFSTKGRVSAVPTTGSAFFGPGQLTVAGTGITFTREHYGFKIIYSGSTATVYATNANGTTETATDITSSLSGSNPTNTTTYTAILDPGVSIKYYIGTTLAATHTTNLPAGSFENNIDFDISNNSTATTFSIILHGFNLQQRDLLV